MTIWKGAAAPISSRAFARAADRLGCQDAALHAIWQVEAAGREFLSDGSLIRRFEPHHMPPALWPLIGFDPGSAAPWRASLGISSSVRERMLQAAYRQDPRAALRATSWGGPQIMGFNHGDAGFDTPAAMVSRMADSGDAHLDAFVALIEEWGLSGAVRARDWLAFARRYNGGGQPEVYARRMEAAYRAASGRSSPVVLRVGARGAAVRELQRALGIAADGAFGPDTLSAVRSFQARAEIPVDGIVGARTWAALKDSRAAQPSAQPASFPALIVALRAIADALGRLFSKGASSA